MLLIQTLLHLAPDGLHMLTKRCVYFSVIIDTSKKLVAMLLRKNVAYECSL